MSNKLFNTIRFIGEIALPALGTLYFTLSQIWGWPYGEEIVGSLAALTVCIGAFVGIKRAGYDG